MSMQVYRVVHFVGLMMVFTGFGGLAVAAKLAEPKEMRKIFSILHGVGMLLLLVGGFGLLAKLGGGFPGWVLFKLILWLFFGGIVVMFRKAPELGKPLALVLPLLGMVAAIMATYKPF